MLKITGRENKVEGDESLGSRLVDVYPDAVVKISRDQYSIYEIRRMVVETKEFLLNPEFQRNRVWRLSQERELVESVLMGIPIPVIYVFETDEGIKQVVDGRQRISAFVRFLDNEFALDGLKMLPDFNKMKFKDLAPIYQSKFERYQLPVYIIEPPTPERLKYDIFDRVNRGGTTLNNQEMRNALYFGPATRLLKKLSQSEAFIKATAGGFVSKRMRDQYAILRFLAFYLLQTGKMEFAYKSNIDDFLAFVLQKMNRFLPVDIANLEQIFEKSMRQAFLVLGADGFRFEPRGLNKRPLNMPLFETLSFFFANIDLSNIDSNRVGQAIVSLKREFDNSGFFKSRVDSSESVAYRYKEITRLLEEIKCSDI
ncbi:MAG: hypothetical protein GQF41_0476 [Candidatus Rifleibacterium amylolyticum]|nr:MAG: hypothetical protein GQF41_0476 [Candidatus Rifleibacterium amylolyticum]